MDQIRLPVDLFSCFIELGEGKAKCIPHKHYCIHSLKAYHHQLIHHVSQLSPNPSSGPSGQLSTYSPNRHVCAETKAPPRYCTGSAEEATGRRSTRKPADRQPLHCAVDPRGPTTNERISLGILPSSYRNRWYQIPYQKHVKRLDLRSWKHGWCVQINLPLRLDQNWHHRPIKCDATV